MEGKFEPRGQPRRRQGGKVKSERKTKDEPQARRRRLDQLVGAEIRHWARGRGVVTGVLLWKRKHRLAVRYKDGLGCANEGDYAVVRPNPTGQAADHKNGG